MKLPVVYHELAERELNDAALYYHAEGRLGLAEAFLAEVARVTELLARQPLAGTSVRGDLRQWRLRRFPYFIVYRVRADQLRILALAAQKRRPAYWQGRT